ncbi:MAG: hypothetical protein FJZ47_16830 [Candidatus Tectomicrobia bacterium]|uniref:Uncharacterized protein n=1 Tax=Tectimicrobiota bacterium TaxID=2528274 RepID=A0A938B3V5_UNCTE|nr:hypothetical protein [Candidatus Tectomicrobia bacterium]
MSTAAAGAYRDFVARLLTHAGALVEPVEPSGLEAMLPAEVQQTLHAPEIVRLGFAAELPPDAQRISLESDWLDRFGHVLGERGRRFQRVVYAALPALSHPERIVEHGLVLQNAVYRFSGVTPAWTRCLILLCRYTAISDDKRTGMLTFGLNLANGSALDACVEPLLAAVLQPDDAPETLAPPATALPAVWPAARLQTAVSRALPARLQAQLTLFLQGMERRLERDLIRVHDYYTGLRQEAWSRLHRQRTDAAREQLRLEAAEREYQAKVADLRQKYALRVTVDLEQSFELISPVQRFELTLKRRKGERRLTLDWHPLARRLEAPPCAWSYAAEITRVVCDDALHLVSPAGHAPCQQCGKSYCRACQPRQCPRCNQPHDRH